MGEKMTAVGNETGATRWTALAAPSLDDFETIARASLELIPQELRAYCTDLVMQVAEFPDDDMLASVGAEDPFDLLGLFEGLGLAEDGGRTWTGRQPNRIWLFRRPILDYWAEHEETLGAVIAHVLIHEIGHHFGLSDDDMEALEDAAD